jgi:hypothetical protein
MNKGDKTVYQYGSFEPTLDPSYISLDNIFKQVVRLDEAMMASPIADVVLLVADMKKRYIYYEYGLIFKISELELLIETTISDVT